jgi:hypothetical protein
MGSKVETGIDEGGSENIRWEEVGGAVLDCGLTGRRLQGRSRSSSSSSDSSEVSSMMSGWLVLFPWKFIGVEIEVVRGWGCPPS